MISYLAEFWELFFVDVFLGPVALDAAVDVDADAVLVGPHHALDVVLVERADKLGVGVGTVLGKTRKQFERECGFAKYR